MEQSGRAAALRAGVAESLKNAFHAWCMLVRAMLPVTILVKVLTEFDLLRYIVAPFKPIMSLVGLPPDLGIAWVTSMCVNLYAGLFVYADILKTLPDSLSVAQATTFAVMSLLAHGLFVEGKIAQYCGLNMPFQIAFRIVAAFVFGFLFSSVCGMLGVLEEPARMLYTPSPAPESLVIWALLELRSYVMLLGIVSGLMLLMRLLGALGITGALNRLLAPLLRLMGIAPSAATITVVGLTTGLSYGGGLIIGEARGGRLAHRDIFTSVTFMGLSHAMIEDTLIMAALGASLAGTVWGRLGYSFILMFIMARLLRRFGRPQTAQASAKAA